MQKKAKIKWTNKFSKETGYVKKLNRKKKYFENTFEKSEAMQFIDTEENLKKAINLLNTYCPDNIYEVVKE